MSKAMDNLKEELKTLYSDENLTDKELEEMAKKLVSFFELGLKMRYQYGAEYVLCVRTDYRCCLRIQVWQICCRLLID